MRTLRRAVDALWLDLTYAVRGLRRAPGLTIAVVSSLAIGVGANVATFTVLDRVLFQAPPGVNEPGNVRRIHSSDRAGKDWSTRFAYPVIGDFSKAAGGRARVEGFQVAQQTIGDIPAKVSVAYVTPGYFDMLGVGVERGRLFSAEESSIQTPQNVVIISHGLWSGAFGRDATILGRTVRIDDKPMVVIGVAESGFEGTDQVVVSAWAPLGVRPAGSESSVLESRGWYTMSLLARVSEGADELLEDVFSAAFARNNPVSYFGNSTRVHLAPLLEARIPPLQPQMYNQRNLVLAKRLAIISAAVLLVAATNVASLLLMRTIRRRHEIAVRLALGASGRRLISQVATESMALSVLAAIGAIVIGWWVGGALRTAFVFNVRWSATPFVHRAMILAAALAAIGGLVAAFLPALVALRRRALEALRYSDATVDPMNARLRAGLLIVQAAVCVALLSSGGIFLQSIRRAAYVDVGVDANQLITIDASGRQLFEADVERALARLHAMPEIETVAAAKTGLWQYVLSRSVAVRGEAHDSMPAQSNWVDSNYFQATGLRVTMGRGIDGTDVMGSPRVSVISESMAKILWGERNPLGECLMARPDGLEAGQWRRVFSCWRVVGVYQDLRFEPTAPPIPHVFFAMSQSPMPRENFHGFVVRTRASASGSVVSAISRILTEEFSPGGANMPPRVHTMAERLAPFTKPWRAAALLLALVGVLAALSTAAGIYGMVSYDVAQRTRELGVRIAMGAGAPEIMATVLGGAARSVGVGIAAGVGLAALGAYLFAGLLFETTAYDPAAITVSILCIVLATGFASVMGARRAMTLDPAAALRAE